MSALRLVGQVDDDVDKEMSLFLMMIPLLNGQLFVKHRCWRAKKIYKEKSKQ